MTKNPPRTIRATFASNLGVLGLWFVSFASGCGHSSRNDPHEVWMTYRDGPLPAGENGYFDSSDEIANGDKSAERYASYAFCVISRKIQHPGDAQIRCLLETSIAQCRSNFVDAYRRGALRQVNSLRNVKNSVGKQEFKPKYIVFLMYVTTIADRNDKRAWSTEADFGAVVSVDQVFSAKQTVGEVAKSAKIVTQPHFLREPSRSGPMLDFWQDTTFRIIDDFEFDSGLGQEESEPDK